jgi:hypothetical protein
MSGDGGRRSAVGGLALGRRVARAERTPRRVRCMPPLAIDVADRPARSAGPALPPRRAGHSCRAGHARGSGDARGPDDAGRTRRARTSRRARGAGGASRARAAPVSGLETGAIAAPRRPQERDTRESTKEDGPRRIRDHRSHESVQCIDRAEQEKRRAPTTLPRAMGFPRSRRAFTSEKRGPLDAHCSRSACTRRSRGRCRSQRWTTR